MVLRRNLLAVPRALNADTLVGRGGQIAVRVGRGQDVVHEPRGLLLTKMQIRSHHCEISSGLVLMQMQFLLHLLHI